MGLVWIGPYAKTAWAPDYPWGSPSEEESRAVEQIRSAWGTPAHAQELLRSDIRSVADDEEWIAWVAKYLRYSMSPGEAIRFEQMWYETDSRAILPAVSVPTLLICPVLSHDPGDDSDVVQQARDVAERIVGSRLAILPPGDWAPLSPGRQDQIVGEVRAFVDDLAAEQVALDRVLATVLFTDIVDSTARASELGDRAWGDVVERHHAIVRSFLNRYRGVEVDTAGDGFFATFDGPARAVRCARSVADAVRPLGVQVRAGVHTGEVETIDRKAGGLAVVIGARIGGLAQASEVLVSSTVKDLTAGSGLTFEDAGEHELKGVPDRWRLYRVVGG
jgi:class 3 adenylate cyclase